MAKLTIADGESPRDREREYGQVRESKRANMKDEDYSIVSFKAP